MKPVKVGFIGDYSNEWVGGVNYIKNLLYALDSLKDRKITPIVFISPDTDAAIVETLSAYAEIHMVSVLKRKSLRWFLWRATKKLFNTEIVLEFALRSYRIDVFSHSHLYRCFFSKTVNWIPDFQHLHLPHMFSAEEIKSRNQSFLATIRYGDRVLLSSEDAKNDLAAFAPQYLEKARVLNFVAQPRRGLLEDHFENDQKILMKYHLNGNFFYLPNQFWKHKNHQIVFEALQLLKQKGISVTLVCSGKLKDYRNQTHIDELTAFIAKHSLDVHLLGLIDYDDVIVLMKKSLSVINPSLFEGWSSTVEECKVIGKKMILSDIRVHREQAPAEGLYFNPADANALASCIESVLAQPPSMIKPMDIDFETEKFALNFQKIILGV